MSVLRTLLTGAALLAALAAGMWLGGHPDRLPEPLRSVFVDERVDTVARAQELITDNYFEEIDRTELEDRSIASMVRLIQQRSGDRFSHYFDPETYERFRTAQRGTFSGVGMAVTEVDDGLRVADVYEGSPAEQEGLRMGDVIVSVDGESIAGWSSEASAARIKGPEGTTVELTFRRNGSERTISVERAEITVPVVAGEAERAGDADVAYVRLATFTGGAHGQLRDQLDEVFEEGADQGIVLDLRGNGGGLLREAILVSSVFIDDGTIVTTEGRARSRRAFEASGDAIDRRPLVVLVNPDSASASEIVAAALQERGKATVVGDCPEAEAAADCTTFGKGSVQEVIPLPNGGALDLTVAEYLTAEGVSINERGVVADVLAADDPDTEDDEALDRALEVLGELVAAER